MPVLNINDVSISFGDRKILNKINFSAEAGEKIGIIGVNGAGKTTLLNIILGIYHTDEGNIYISKGFTPGYLKQEADALSNLTLFDAVLESYNHLIEMEKEIKSLEKLISVENDSSKLDQLMKRYSSISEKFKTEGGFEYNGRARGILNGLGFDENEYNFPVSKLSGGQRTRLMMARLLANEPGILILDEPTNHLDINALGWLEGFIRDYKKTVIMVSHDRYFLDKVCTGIYEVENGSGAHYTGNYSSYVNKKMNDREIQQRSYNNQQKEIKRLEDFIEQQRRWNREKNIIAAESRMKAIDRMDIIDAPQDLPSKIRLKIKSAINSGNDVLDVNDLSVSFGGKEIFKNISFEVKKNEKVFILGPNGCGKSTLLKTLISRIVPSNGTVGFGHKVFPAYYDQELSDLNPQNTIYDEILELDQIISQTDIRNALAAFLFTGDDVFKKIDILSGGEKSRVLLTKLILSNPNFIIMDEPTNHLDINSREVLEEALQDFDGTLICVSHDRYFIKKLATRIIEFTSDGIFDYKGDYESYMEYKKSENTAYLKEVDKKISESKEIFLSAKEQKAKERKLQKSINDAESQIEYIENRLLEIEEEMNHPEVIVDHVKLSELYDEKSDLSVQLDELYSLWESLSSN